MTEPSSTTRAAPVEDNSRALIVIAICTRGRDASLTTLLKTLHIQRQPKAFRIAIVVIDNNDTPRITTDAFDDHPSFDFLVVHQARPGLVSARNTALDTAEKLGADWIISLDDDEWVAPDWLDQMTTAMTRGESDILIGPTVFEYGTDTSRFVPQRQLPRLKNGITPKVMTTGNCAISSAVFDSKEGAGMRFDPRFDQSGGEDTDFMLRAHRAHGFRVHGCPDAIVCEKRTGERATLRYQLRRTLRSQILIYTIAKLHKKNGTLTTKVPLFLTLLDRTGRCLWKGLRLLLRAVLILPFNHKKALRIFGRALERLTQAVAIIPYYAGIMPLDYGQSSDHSQTLPQ